MANDAESAASSRFAKRSRRRREATRRLIQTSPTALPSDDLAWYIGFW
jgi:hypothetical protein